MKHKLLSLFALAGAMFMSTSAMAQSWTEPVAVEPAMGAAAEPEDGGVYFLYNAATDLYVGAGNNWGTHVVATTVSDAFPATFWNEAIALGGAGDAMGSGQALPIHLTKTDDGSYYLQHMGTNRGDRYLTSEDGNSWIDGNSGRSMTFFITATEGGYTIQAKNTVEQGTYFGVDEGETAHEDYEQVALNVMNNIAAGERAVWQFLSTNYKAWNAYSARVKLYELYLEIQESGYTVDCSAAKAVFDNASATVEQLEAATSELRRQYNKVKFQDVFSGASEDNPIDVTADCLTNPDFEIPTGNGAMPPGWTITITGQNCGQQNRTDTNPETGLAITNFIEAWHPQSLGDGVIAQTVYDMPKGKYVLECDASACHDPQAGDGTDIEGVNLFIEAGQYKATTRISNLRLHVQHYSVTFINDGSEVLTFGLEAVATNANWLSADNFKIIYYGETEDTPELATMKAELAKAQELAEESEFNNIESTDDINYSAEARNALATAISDAEAAISGDAAAQTAATQALKDAMAAVDASKKVYAQFKAVYESGNVVLDQLIENNQWTDLQGSIEDFLEGDLLQAFEAGTLSADQLEEFQTKVNTLVQEFVSDPSVIHVGDDLTILLANPHFTQGNGRDINTVPGWVVNNGSMTELRSSTHNIEAWHRTFDISQTLHNLPAGVYDITLQGFVRHDGAATEQTWMYGGISKVKLFDLFQEVDQMRDTPFFTADYVSERPALGDTNYDASRTEGWVPNGMSGSYYWFNEINPNTGEPYYTNHVEVVLDKDGDLTIGIHSEATEDWVIFDNFRIKYTGMNVAVFAKMVEEKKTELSNLYDTQEPTAIAADVDKLVAEKLAINTSDIDNADDALAAIAEIDAVIAKVKESTAAYTALGEVIEYFEVKVGEASLSVSGDFSDLVDNSRREYESGYATIDAMKAAQNALAEGWAGAASQDIQAGDDVTELILNPIYEGLIDGDGSYGDNFWTKDTWNGVDYSCCEFFNYLNENAHFTHYQTLKGIKPGYYTVSVDGFYRYGDYNPNTDAGTPGAGNAYANGEEEQNAVMFVQSAEGDNSIALKSIFDGAQSEMIGVGNEVQAEGTSGYIPNNMEAAQAYLEMGLYNVSLNVKVGDDGELTIGIRKSQGIYSDWTIFTGWTLKYLGTEAPDAVEAIDAQAAGKAAIFGIDGRQQSQLRRGINIVRSNGKVEKVLVK